MKKTRFLSTSALMLGVIVCLLLESQFAKADFVFGEPTKVPNVNSDFSEGTAQISHDGLELYFSSNREGGSSKIWVSSRTSIEDPWSLPVKLGAAVGDSFPSPSADGLELYFPAEGDIWVSTRASKDDPWGAARNLGPTVNSENEWDGQPCISADGLSLYFMSTKFAAKNNEILVTTRLSKDDPWSEPVQLGPNVNSNLYEYTPFISPDGLSLFFSRGAATANVYVSRRASTTEPWGVAEPFAPVNSVGTNISVSFSDNDSTIYFTRGSDLFTPDFNIWQAEVTPIVDFNGDGAVNSLDLNELQDHLSSTDSLYDIAPIPLGDGIADDKDLLALKKHLSKKSYPVNKAIDIPREVVLSWEPIEFAQTYDVYFGTDYSDVKDATTADSCYMQHREATSFDPGRLDVGKTYYWRVDRANGAPDFSLITGDVWSFTIEPYSIQIPGSSIGVTASSVTNEFSIPENTINGSGLDATDAHSISSEDMWFTASVDLDPWIQYEFDEVKKLDVMHVWNSNSPAETAIGWGVKDVQIEFSVDGENWDVLEEANQFSRASGLSTYNQYDEIVFGGVSAKYVRLNIESNWGGMLLSYSLSEVQFFMIPTQARTPVPASGSVDVFPDTIVTWRTGREADQHTIYVSDDPNAVANGLAPSASSMTNIFDLSSFGLQVGEIYYWRVDEVNDTETPSVWTGPVWSFSTSVALIVDDFESYTKFSPNRPFQTWLDGVGYSADEFFPAEYGGNNTGSGVGHDIWAMSSPHYMGSLMEMGKTIPGSFQSMPFYYNNIGGISSQIDRKLSTPQDWSAHGIQTLVLNFYGAPDNTGQLYIKINDIKIPYEGDASNLARTAWTAWQIDLSPLAVSNVNALSIGIDGDGANGMLLLDDIGLHR